MCLSLLLAACVAASSSDAGERARELALDPNLPYQAELSEPVTYTVDYSVVVTAPYHTALLKVWLPLPQTDSGQEVDEGELTTFPTSVEPQVGTETAYGNKFAYFEFGHPQGAQIIRHTFQVKVWELRWNIDPQTILPVDQWPDGFARYLRGDDTVVVDRRFKGLADEIMAQGLGPHPLASVMAWVNGHMKYDHAAASLRASSVHALETRAGHCSDYHGLCAALGRALGYPTRVTYGIQPLPKSSPSHCKLEAFLPPYGWVSFDVSETQKLIELINGEPDLSAECKARLIGAANDRLFRGFRDNTWFLQTRGTDYELAPPAGRRVPLVRTIYAEADGVPLPEPDPANPQQVEFAWMTSHKYTPDRPVSYPFKDWKQLWQDLNEAQQ